MAATDDIAGADRPAKKGGLMALLIPVLVLTVLAAGGGGLIGTQIVAAVKGPAAGEIKPVPPPVAPETVVRELSPIVTNLASPDNASWVRLQAAIVYNTADAAQIDLVASKIADDVLTVIRTLTLAQLQGASGLELLREDLNERASIRSDGHVRELMIEMLVIQ